LPRTGIWRTKSVIDLRHLEVAYCKDGIWDGALDDIAALAASAARRFGRPCSPCCPALQRIYEERNALIRYFCQNLNPSLENVRGVSKKIGKLGKFSALPVFLLAAIEPHRLDGDGQCAS
jgi:hypothetical protein